jgi:hypothetical protein
MIASMNGIRNSSLSRIELDLVVGVEDLAFVEAERLDDVLVGVGVDRFFEGLAQQELPALGRRDVAVGAQHDVVGGQRIGGDEEAEVALDDAALVFGQAVRVLPGRDVARHVDLLRHPVVGAGGEVLLPGPLVLERHQLVDVGLAVDDALVGAFTRRRASTSGMEPAATGCTRRSGKGTGLGDAGSGDLGHAQRGLRITQRQRCCDCMGIRR